MTVPRTGDEDTGATLRQGSPADIDAIRDLTLAAYAHWVPVIGCEPLPMMADYGEAMRHHRFDLLDDDGALAGLIETVAGADHLLVVNVAVRPSCQGYGFGRRLLAHAEQLTRDAGFDRVRLYTNARFAANVRLYERLGYGIDREEEVDGRHRLHMSKPV